MSDLHDVLYTKDELLFLQKFVGQTIQSVHSDESIFTSVTCQSGLSLQVTPEELWVSSQHFDDVGYSWIKKVIFSQQSWSSDDYDVPEISSMAGHIIEDIVILRTAVFFSEILDEGKDQSTGIESVDELIQDLSKTCSSQSFDIQVVNPERLKSIQQPLRYSLVDIGFLLKVADQFISITTYDNFFWLTPVVITPDMIDASFKQKYQGFLISSLLT